MTQTTINKDKSTTQDIILERLRQAEKDVQSQVYRIEEEKLKLISLRLLVKRLQLATKYK